MLNIMSVTVSLKQRLNVFNSIFNHFLYFLSLAQPVRRGYNEPNLQQNRFHEKFFRKGVS